MPVELFSTTLRKHGLALLRRQTCILQVNVGRLCNQRCRHCHLDAGPNSVDIMSESTMDEVVDFARRGRFQVVDITGGAPEMNPHLSGMIEKLSALGVHLMLRSNLTALESFGQEALLRLCRRHRVAIIASFPSLNASQTQAQRGPGVWDKSIVTLRSLNALGYGQPGSALELHLVSNPAGAFLPSPQDQTEKRFRKELQEKWGIVFHQLYTFANAPLGRFREWLVKSGNFEAYLLKLASSFNPCTVEGLMCRTLVSVSWDGYCFDCDFNQAAGLFMNGIKTHISALDGPPEPEAPIAVSDHCYACTAGTGFT